MRSRSWAKPRAMPVLWISADSMRTVKANVQEIWTDHIAKFPPERASQEMPSTTLDTRAADS
eukprot:4834828-Lingulodinium_polyedra.AAC.1